jgi:hypothetical protein
MSKDECLHSNWHTEGFIDPVLGPIIQVWCADCGAFIKTVHKHKI